MYIFVYFHFFFPFFDSVQIYAACISIKVEYICHISSAMLPNKTLCVYKFHIFCLYCIANSVHTSCCIEYNINSSYEEKCIFFFFFGRIYGGKGFIFSLWGCFFSKEEYGAMMIMMMMMTTNVEDEICDFENFQLNEIESSFFPFPGGFFLLLLSIFFFIVAIYVIWKCVLKVFFSYISFVWGFL